MMDFIKKLYDANLLNTELLVGVLSFIGGLLVAIVAIIPTLKKNKSDEKEKHQSNVEKTRQPIIEQLQENKEQTTKQYNLFREIEAYIFELAAFSSDEMIQNYKAINHFPAAPSIGEEKRFVEGFELSSLGEIRARISLYNSLSSESPVSGSKLVVVLEEIHKYCNNVIGQFAEQENKFIEQQFEYTKEITNILEDIYTETNDPGKKKVADQKSRLIYTDFVRGSARITGHIISAKEIDEYIDKILTEKEEEMTKLKEQNNLMAEQLETLPDVYKKKTEFEMISRMTRSNIETIAAASHFIDEVCGSNEDMRNAAYQQLEILNQALIRNLNEYSK